MCFGGFKLLPLNSIFLKKNFKARLTPCPDKKINILAFKIAKYELQTNLTTDARTLEKIRDKQDRLRNILMNRGATSDIANALDINQGRYRSSTVYEALVNYYKDKIQQQQAAAVNLEERTLEEQPVERHSPTPDAEETQSISQSNAGASTSGNQSVHLQQNELEHQTNQEILDLFEGLILQTVDNVNHAHEDKEKSKESSKNLLTNLNILYRNIRTRLSINADIKPLNIRTVNLLSRYYYNLLLDTYSFSAEELPKDLIFPTGTLTLFEFVETENHINEILVKYGFNTVRIISLEQQQRLDKLRSDVVPIQPPRGASPLRFSDETPQATDSKQDPSAPKSEEDQISELFEFLDEKEEVENEKDETTIL